jgi:uncharacterized protein
MSLLTPSLVSRILEGYALPRTGVHGVAHWARVLENGRRLAELTGGVDLDVIELFAIFHDSRRVNESVDWGHGKRGAELAVQLRGHAFELDDALFALLEYACNEHTAGKTDADRTVQVCWDSDRLDLLRVHIRPRASLLCTEAARRSSVMDWANDRALHFQVPDLIEKEWELQL